MPSLFVPPVFATREATERARILHFVICATVLIATGFISLAMIQQPATVSRGVPTVVFIVCLGILLLYVNRSGQTRLAGMLFAGGLIFLITSLAVTAGGVRSPGVTMYFVIVLMTGLLLGDRAGAVTALACAGLGFGLLMAERFSLLPPGIQYNSTTIWLLSCLYMGFVIVFLRLPAMLIKTALIQAESELSERKRTEQLLEENQKLLQSMIENTPAAVAMFDTEMRYIAHSKRWSADYRLGNRVLKGLTHYEVFPEIGEDWKAIHRRCLAGAKEAREEDPFLRADGTLDIVRWVVEPWRKGNGDIGGITMFTEVITERVRAREERRLLHNQLLQAQKIEALGTLAGGIAHDFNNLLAMIGTNAELGFAQSQAGERAQICFEEIVKATARAKDVVKQILLFSRRENSAQEIVSLLPIIEDALKFLRATLPTNVEFRTSLEPGVPSVSANAAQIYQMLMNLGTNAGHAMRDGGVLSVTLDRTYVEKPETTASGDLHRGEYVRITVRDTGVGMNRETLDRIFEPFFTTKGTEGTGLGLSVVHGVVKDHHGAIKVESELSKGSSFQVYLPASRAEPGERSRKPRGTVRGKGEHILYIDDETVLGSSMKRVLELLGYRCTVYSNPEAALEAFRINPDQFDAVISDMTMPFLSGFDVAKALQAIRPNIPIALTSGRSSSETDIRAFSLGIKSWLPKPATIDELSDLLQTLLQNAARGRQAGS
jgi:PAS domain S-box-containing protein